MDISSFYKKQGYERSNIKYRIISFGAGTQSIAMTLMALEGKFGDKPDFGVFCDTHAEPQVVYDYLDTFKKYVKKKYNFDIYETSNGNLIDDVLSEGRSASLPYHVKKDDGKNGILLRQCTYEYKILPFHKFIKEKLDIPRKNKHSVPYIETWFAISTDEMTRIKESNKWYSVHRYPLIEKNVHRVKSIRYVESLGFDKPPRSSCVVCPYRSDKEWNLLKKEELELAIDFEKKINKKNKIKNKLYLHPSLKELELVDFNKNKNQLEFGFVNECDGYCGI
tara:strand:+ start:502 stop:1338 length:837 start_codon:yes stop_codon:yes gene_type:complete